MKRLLRKGMCLALGLSCLPASAQELNFRAVAPRPAAAATSEIPISLGQSRPIDPAGVPVFRGKVGDDAGLIVPVSSSQIDGIRFVQRDVPRPSPLPTGAPGEFVPPAPQIVSPPQDPATYVGSPIVGSPQFGSTIVGSPFVGSPMVGPAPGMVVSGPVSSGGCACSGGGGFSLFNGFIGDDALGCSCGNSCGVSCTSCDPCWHPLERIRDFFCCACNTGCCDPRPGFWLRGEYLLWNATHMNLPALVAQAPTAAQLNSPAGSIIYGNNGVPDAIQNGGRITMGFWFPRHSDWGMDASYFYLGNRATNFLASSDGSAALGRPVTNVTNGLPGTPAAQIVSTNGVPGTVSVDTNTKIWGVDANLRHKLCCTQGFWIDGLIGYRHFDLSDNINIQENIGPVAAPGINTLTVNDHFGTQNSFNGAQLGLEAEWRFLPRFTFGGFLKVAGGDMHQAIDINGSTTGVFNGAAPINFAGSATQRGGLLAQPSNIGGYTSDRFVVIPEIGLKVGWDITSRWRFLAGYNIMYVSNVVRAGDQIDLRVNRAQNAFALPPAGAGQPPQPGPSPVNPNLPAVPFRSSEFWAQGVTLGLEYRY